MNKSVLICCIVLCLWGCHKPGGGRIFTHVTEPYSRDFNNTPVGTRHCELNAHRLKEPVSGYGVTVEWSSSQIQAAARAAGIEKISYIDVQTISLLMGLYTRRKLIIYGD